LDITRNLAIGLRFPLHLACGAEFRYENYQIDAGEEASYIYGGISILDGPNAGKPAAAGAQGFSGFQPANETARNRHSIAAYLDLEQQVTRNFFAELAGRFESYSDFGSRLNGKLALRYQVLSGLSLRGSASTGFRAPSLGQSFYTSTATVAMTNGDTYQVGTFPVDHPLSRALGATDLEPEESLHLSGGIVSCISNHFFFGLDCFVLSVKNRVVLTGEFTNKPSVFGNEIAALLNQFGVSGARFFTNAVDTSTQGLEAFVRFEHELGAQGKINLSAAFQANRTRIVGDINAPPLLSAYNNLMFDRKERARIEHGQPEHVFILTSSYQNKRIKGGIKAIHYGDIQVVEDAAKPEFDKTLRGQWLLDAHISFRLAKAIDATIGGTNILNSYPDSRSLNPNNPLAGTTYIYHWFSPFGFNGAAYYLRLTLFL
jgi:iron complex outermembrane receptor protein